MSSIDDQVIDFFDRLFEQLFSQPFCSLMDHRRKSRDILRKVQKSADVASLSLTRLFTNSRLSRQQTASILQGFESLGNVLSIYNISNPNIAPEVVFEMLLIRLPCPQVVEKAGQDAIYRDALYRVVQVLMFVGPVMAEWKNLSFPEEFSVFDRIVEQLKKIHRAIGHYVDKDAEDELYELLYRDHLLQRFYRINADTVRMTTNLAVDLRELFVMPYVQQRRSSKTRKVESVDSETLMGLSAARARHFGRGSPGVQRWSMVQKGEEINTALDQVKHCSRNVLIGAPGIGKSTFMEWLQVKVAHAEEHFVIADQQAIPLLLRVRQLDLFDLPRGAALVERATASRDRAILMPCDWIQRQMLAGRVLFMLDGLDETEPELRDRYLIPWLRELCHNYPQCYYLVSSRPTGYPPGMLHELGFAECDFLDFEEPQMRQYVRHWCTSVRMARNEPEDEARREGIVDGERIIEGFVEHSHIFSLARNPLMLSVICLVNHFEGGRLPEDRAVLYRLCVEGLLDRWDRRRGIHSEFGFDEKLQTCREVALVMQASDRAECEADQVQKIFAKVLSNPARAEDLLEHIRHRTGLLLERRPGVFAFAHLTFQEYLAARAVCEGNSYGVDAGLLAQEHDDFRWLEVIPLYCGLAPGPATRDMLTRLTAQSDSSSLSSVLAEAYLSGSRELAHDHELRSRVLERIALAPYGDNLARFSADEVASIAMRCACKIESNLEVSEAFAWLYRNDLPQPELLAESLSEWRKMAPLQAAELVCLIHKYASDNLLAEVALEADIYATGVEAGLRYNGTYMALIGLSSRKLGKASSLRAVDAAFLQILRTLAKYSFAIPINYDELARFLKRRSVTNLPHDATTINEFMSLLRQLAHAMLKLDVDLDTVHTLRSFADSFASRPGETTSDKLANEKEKRGSEE